MGEQHRWRSGAAPLVPRADRRVSEARLAAVLLGMTALTTFGVYLITWQEAGAWHTAAAWRDAALFTSTLLGILGAHELGHWVVARPLGVRLSLPWFLPFPLWTGTMGAIMRLEQPPRDRTALLVMGAAGPLAGLTAIVAVVALRMAAGGEAGGAPLARPLLWWAVGVVVPGPTPALGTADPVGFAAWIGCLVTTLNLLPVGQLDGGHVLAALWPEHGVRIAWITIGVLLVAGLLWPGWAVWAVLLVVLGTWRPVQLDGPAPDQASLALAAGCALAWLVCATPVPF